MFTVHRIRTLYALYNVSNLVAYYESRCNNLFTHTHSLKTVFYLKFIKRYIPILRLLDWLVLFIVLNFFSVDGSFSL